MPLFVISCSDKPDCFALRARVRDGHLNHITAAGAAVVFAGPYLDEQERSIGSMYVLSAECEAAARTFIDTDPYTVSGLFQSVDIKPWRLVVSNCCPEVTGD